MKNLLVFLSLLLVIGCASTGPTTQEVMNSWVGQHKSTLIASWGPPARYAEDGKGGEVLIYATSFVYYATTYWNYKMFYCDETGKIYHWLTRTDAVPPMQIVIY